MPASRVEFATVFRRLRSILAVHASKLEVVHDRPDYYYLNTYTVGPNKRPISFGGVRMGKGYVSYYLMPVYSPEIGVGMSPALRKHMQGKACFNFKHVDDELFAELQQVTRQCYAAWKKIEWVD
ncbi:MAG: hypothetical protein ACHQWU_02125 [Gemmatimonadales bacterium]